MLHSIISFKDKNGVLVDFYRLKYKHPNTVLRKTFEGFVTLETFKFFREDMKRMKTVTIHYTESSSEPENLTYECTFDDFMKQYNNFKNNNCVKPDLTEIIEAMDKEMGNIEFLYL